MQEQNAFQTTTAANFREEDRDLGFGAKVATESRLRF